jgi:hypothetical protein
MTAMNMTFTKQEDKQMTAIVTEIKCEQLIDEYPDLSWLDQFKDSTDPEEQLYYKRDQERLAAYGDDWHMVGIRAVAKVKVPTQGSWIMTRISSPGLWGIESDSAESYFNEVFQEERQVLINMLDELGTYKIEELSK